MMLHQWLYMKFTKNFTKTKIDELSFFREYVYNGSYSRDNVFAKENLNVIIQKFKAKVTNDNTVSIESKFNNKYYPVFDLDTQEHLDLFKTLYTDSSYVIFCSSAGHYWGFLDNPVEKLEDVFYDHNWKICNDEKYISFCRAHNVLAIRGVYETEARKPNLYHINGNLSKNFQLFIDKMAIYYSKEGLELSVLRYKDPAMLVKFNRKQKLQQLSKRQNEETEV